MPRNLDHEPGIAVTRAGRFWVVSDIGNGDPRAPLGALGAPADLLARGSDVWVSVDGGRSYQWVAAPFNPLPARPGPLSGGDTDIAVASARNAEGRYNVYVASLYASVVDGVVVGDVSLAISQDDGRSWLVDPVAATVPWDDRPWLAADGACTLYLAYHGLPTTATVVDRYDVCDLASNAPGATVVPLSSSRYVTLLPQAAQNRPDVYVLAGFGKPAVDSSRRSPFRHRIYIPAMDCSPLATTDEVNRAVGSNANCPNTAQVYMQISADRGQSWTLRHVAASDNGAVANFAAQTATDDAGDVYIVWFDDHHAYIDRSSDGGTTWTTPTQIDTAPALAAAYPTISAGRAGHIDVAFYGTDRSGDVNDTKTMGLPGAPGAAQWRVYRARSSDGGQTFTQDAATGVVHTGAVCTQGDNCSSSNNTRDLLDDFGIATNPTSGQPSIAYTSDQPQSNFANDYTGYATDMSDN